MSGESPGWLVVQSFERYDRLIYCWTRKAAEDWLTRRQGGRLYRAVAETPDWQQVQLRFASAGAKHFAVLTAMI